MSEERREEEELEIEETEPRTEPPETIQEILQRIGIIAGVTAVLALIFAATKQVQSVVAVIILGTVYTFLCYQIIGGEERALKRRWGRPLEDKVYNSGLVGKWWPIEDFYIFPTEEQQVDLPPQIVITAIKEIATKTSEGTTIKKLYSEAKIRIDTTFYWFWPETAKELVNAYKKAPNPNNKPALLNFFGNSVAALVRRVSGRYSWLEIRQGTDEYLREIHDEIKNEPMSPVVMAGVKKFRVYNTDVKLPEGLEEAITAPQIARLKKEATITTAEGEQARLTKEGIGRAEAERKKREAIFKTVKEYEDGVIIETLLTLREMALGQASTIFYELPTQITGRLGKALESGEIKEGTAKELLELWKLMPEETRKKIKDFVEKQKKEIMGGR